MSHFLRPGAFMGKLDYVLPRYFQVAQTLRHWVTWVLNRSKITRLLNQVMGTCLFSKPREHNFPQPDEHVVDTSFQDI